jgi:hypothetical protein
VTESSSAGLESRGAEEKNRRAARGERRAENESEGMGLEIGEGVTLRGCEGATVRRGDSDFAKATSDEEGEWNKQKSII